MSVQAVELFDSSDLARINERRGALARRLSFAKFSRYAGYVPHDAQRQVHDSHARFRLAVCGRRFGKSMLAAHEAAFGALAPDARVWVVAPYRELAGRVFNRARDILLYRLRLAAESDRATEMTLKFPWGAELIGKTAENADSLLGEGLDFVVLDEAPRIRDAVFARYIMPALVDRRGRALIIGSPSGRGWVRRLAVEAASDADWDVFNFASAANPYLDTGELALHRRLISDLDYRREYLAEWIADAGLVYPMFEARRHVADARYDAGLPIYLGVDFGFTNPGCALFAQLTAGETVLVLDEIYRRGLTATEWASEILRKASEIATGSAKQASYKDDPYRRMERVGSGNVLICNPAGADLVAFCDPSGAGERAVLERAGIATIAPRAGVMDGIARVRALLAPGDAQVPPRIVVSPKCRNLIREFATYTYEEGSGDAGASGILAKSRRFGGSSALLHNSSSSDSPDSLESAILGSSRDASEKVVKRDDHALDALRYLVVGLGV